MKLPKFDRSQVCVWFVWCDNTRVEAVHLNRFINLQQSTRPVFPECYHCTHLFALNLSR